MLIWLCFYGHLLCNYISFSYFLPIALILFSMSISTSKRPYCNRPGGICHLFPISRNTSDQGMLQRHWCIIGISLLSLSLSLFLCVSSHLFASGSLVMLNNTISMVNAWKENWLVFTFGYIYLFLHLKTIIDSVISKFLLPSYLYFPL